MSLASKCQHFRREARLVCQATIGRGSELHAEGAEFIEDHLVSQQQKCHFTSDLLPQRVRGGR